MKKKIIEMLIIISFGMALVGCNTSDTHSGGTKQIAIPMEKTDENDDLVDVFTDIDQQTDLGSYYIGPQKRGQVYVYSGQEVHIPFKVEGMSETQADFGLVFFVDGFPQPFKIQKNNNDISTESHLHKFSLSNNKIELFDIVFTPTAGEKGEKVGVIFATIFKPDYMPESEDRANYGVYHSITAPMPQELSFETGVPVKEKKVFTEFKEENIPEEISNRYAEHDSNSNMLDNMVILSLTPDNEKTNSKNSPIFSKNEKIHIRLRIMGGIDGATYSTNIYIDHQPIKIMGFDCLKTKVKKGKMYTAEFELNMKGYKKFSTIYAISNPIGRDYLADMYFPIKTKSRLVVLKGD